jgi:hypothetical protein
VSGFTRRVKKVKVDCSYLTKKEKEKVLNSLLKQMVKEGVLIEKPEVKFLEKFIKHEL